MELVIVLGIAALAVGGARWLIVRHQRLEHVSKRLELL
jgi:hypothetical protein